MASSVGGLARACASCGMAEPEGPLTFPQCARCFKHKLSSTFYCSAACQKSDWPNHKYQCRSTDFKLDMTETVPIDVY